MRRKIFYKIISVILTILTVLCSSLTFGIKPDSKVYAAPVAVTIAAGSQNTGYNNERKLVRLSNGWMVALLHDTTNSRIYFMVSKDDGNNWNELTNISVTSTAETAIASKGTTIYCLMVYGGNYTYNTLVKFDATNISGSYGAVNVDTSQSAFEAGCSISVDSSGVLHAVWSSKRSGGPSSFNIRYSKSTDGGATWSSAVDISADNSSAVKNYYPCIVIKPDDNPVIIWNRTATSTTSYIIKSRSFVNNAWAAAADVYNGGTYAQARPNAVVEGNSIHVVWHGKDQTISSKNNIKYSRSNDGGVSWSTNSPYSYNCITSSTSYDQADPSITADKAGKLYVIFTGRASGQYNNIRMLTYDGTSWLTSSIRDMTGNTANNANRPSACANFADFSSPPFIYEDAQSVSVKFQGDLNPPQQQMSVVQDENETTAGNGGRKLVRLSNGWFICGTKNTSTNAIDFNVSKDNGLTWSKLCYSESGQTGNFAITSYGTYVYTLSTVTDSSSANYYKFDAAVVTNTQQSRTCAIDSGRSSFSPNCAITVDQSGNLYAVWSCKNSNNSFNIRYSRTTDSDVLWTQPVSITSDNTPGLDNVNPSIVMRNDNPVIIYNDTAVNQNRIWANAYNGTAWDTSNNGNGRVVYRGVSYIQDSPCAVVDGYGNIHVALQGKDGTDTSVYNIRYSKSTDGGITWISPVKITQGNQNPQTHPSICADKSNRIYILWEGMDIGSCSQIREIIYSGTAWGAICNVTNNYSGDARYPAACESYKNFAEPLFAYRDEQYHGIKFQGMIKMTDVLTNVVETSYGRYFDTNGNGGRKLVRLSNGNLICAASYYNSRDSVKGIRFYRSLDNGVSWALVCYWDCNDIITSYSIGNYGTNVYCFYTAANKGVFFKFNDATIVSGRTLTSSEEPDPGQTQAENASLDVDSTGAIHIAWSAKSSNSFNVRYIKGIVNTDGTISWTRLPVTTLNTSGQDAKAPCIVIKSNNYPVIIYRYNNGTSSYAIKSGMWNGSSFDSADVYNGGAYEQSGPCAIVGKQDSIHTVWYGKDSSETGAYNIRYSAYNGSSWSSQAKLTGGNLYNQINPSITADLNNKLYVIWEGIDKNISKTVNNIRKMTYSGSWGSISTLTYNTSSSGEACNPSACSNYKSFIEPLFIYKDKQPNTIRFSGKLYNAPSLHILKPYQDQVFGSRVQNFTPEIVVSSSDGNTLTCRYYLGDSGTPSETIVLDNVSSPHKVSFSPVDLSGFSSGLYSIKLEVSDAFNTIQKLINFNVDKTPPGISGSMTVTSTETSITVFCRATDSIAGLAVNPYKYIIDYYMESPWISSPSFTMDSLKPNTLYNVKFNAKDKKGNIVAGDAQNIYTKAQIPVLKLNDPTSNTIRVVASDDNPYLTEYQIKVGTSQYVNAGGMLTTTPTWIVLSNKKRVIYGLAPNTQYSIVAKARNANGVETSFSQTVSAATLP